MLIIDSLQPTALLPAYSTGRYVDSLLSMICVATINDLDGNLEVSGSSAVPLIACIFYYLYTL